MPQGSFLFVSPLSYDVMDFGWVQRQISVMQNNEIVPLKALLEYQPNPGTFGRIPRVFLQTRMSGSAREPLRCTCYQQIGN